MDGASYLDNPINTVTQDLSAVVEWKPEVKDILTSRRGFDFEWNPDKEIFEKISEE